MLKAFHDSIGEFYPELEAHSASLEYVDTSIHTYSDKIADDYTHLLKTVILPDLPALGDLKLREVRILASLDFFETPMSPMQISDLLRYDPATVTRATTKLIKAGMVEKTDNHRDTRSVLLSITDKGQVLADNYSRRLRLAFKVLEKEAHAILSDDEKQTYLNFMLKMSMRSTMMRKAAKNFHWNFNTDGPVARSKFR